MSYQNPVYPHSCPDPFVLKYCGEYWCYSTFIQPDGRCFGILQSTDLVHWKKVGSAMDPLPGDYPCYWAPEATYRDGIFYLYYSVGDEEHMQIRVATARHPAGPFSDSGRRLTEEKFAIDPHIFEDEDGSVYMFYAADFLDAERIGTGTVMDRMVDPFTLAGNPRPVTRARFDWQIYDPQRAEKGGVCWHTVEGPFVLKHHGRYYQMFSGGNWQRASYGVAYGVSDRLDAAAEWEQPCDGQSKYPILRSIPEAGVIGPGHNSVVRGPDNRERFCIYHRWQPETEERVMAIDRLGWEGDALQVYGPSTTPQPDPAEPTIAGFDRFTATAGNLERAGNECRLEPLNGEGEARAVLAMPIRRFTLEVTLRSDGGSGEWGSSLEGDRGDFVRLLILSEKHEIVLVTETEELHSGIPAGFAPAAFHLLRIDAGEAGIKVSVDGNRLSWRIPGARSFDRIQLIARRTAGAFTGFALTAEDPS